MHPHARNAVERPRTNTLAGVGNPERSPVHRGRPQSATAHDKEGGQTAQDRVTYGYRLVAARKPKPIVANILVAAYNEVENFKKNTEAADKLLDVGESKRDETINNAEHAA